jgi:hypothetical protein
MRVEVSCTHDVWHETSDSYRARQASVVYTVSREVFYEHTEELSLLRLADMDDNGSIIALHKRL